MRSLIIGLILPLLAGSILMAQTPASGKRVFESRCAMCHGDDGNGGEFAPGILTRIPARTDADLTTVIRDGLPNRGMPPVKLDDQSLATLIEYLRSLRPPRRGEMAATPLTVELTDGRKLTGLAVNQSHEDLQLRTTDGRVHLLRRAGPRFREVTSQVDWSS